MTSDEQKKLLRFLKHLEGWRKHREKLDRAVKDKEPADVRQQGINITLDLMQIDRDLPDMIKICTWEQLNLFEKK